MATWYADVRMLLTTGKSLVWRCQYEMQQQQQQQRCAAGCACAVPTSTPMVLDEMTGLWHCCPVTQRHARRLVLPLLLADMLRPMQWWRCHSDMIHEYNVTS